MSRYRVECYYHPHAELINDYSSGDMICSECGLVVADRCIDEAAEWRNFQNENGTGTGSDKNRCGAAENKLFNGSNLTTKIGQGRGENAAKYRSKYSTYSASSSTSSYQQAAKRRKMENPPTQEPEETEEKVIEAYLNQKKKVEVPKKPSEKASKMAYKGIEEITAKLKIGEETTFLAKGYFTHVDKIYELRNCPKSTKAVACVYAACKKDGNSLTVKQILAATPFIKKDMIKVIKHIFCIITISWAHIQSAEFLMRFINKLELPKAAAEHASKVAKKMVKENLVRNMTPISIAVASIYAGAKQMGISKHLQEVGDACEVIDETFEIVKDFLNKHRQQIMSNDKK